MSNSDDPFDAFKAAKSEYPSPVTDNYKPSNIYGKLSDLDHAKVARGPFGSVKVTSLQQARVQQAVAHLPQYESMAEFMRDAIEHRLHYWEAQGDMDPELCADIRESQAYSRFFYRFYRNKSYAAMLEEVKEQARNLDSPLAKVQFYEDLKSYAELISDEYWKARFIEFAEG
jgi:Arc/MetJ-type ribon-helix-helix transcriptional regulator